jgi:hypothetical protein
MTVETNDQLILDQELLTDASKSSLAGVRTKAEALQDLLNDNRFHLNGFDQTKTSMLGTYMGILDHEVIRRVVEATPDLDWQAGVTFWRHCGDLTGSPTFYLLASWVERLAGLGNNEKPNKE